MTVGLPGTGIGGMFYLLSALAMPLREAYRLARGRAAPGRWAVVAGQIAIAGGIIAGLWATGWLLGLGLAAARPIVPLLGHAPAGNVLRITTFVLTFGTLGGVLLGVELLRLWHRHRPRRDDSRGLPASRAAAPRAKRRRARTLVAGILCIAVTAHPRPAAAQQPTKVATRLARADSALRVGDSGAAEREYAAVLAADPENSRAVYRLAQLRRSEPAEALRLFQRYAALVPRDPWGYMAVGDVLARSGRYGEALESYDRAVRLAPGERDAVVGRAGVLARAGRTDAAIAAYRDWLTLHPSDAQSWRELGRQALRAGRPADAATALSRAQTLAPDGATALRLALARSAAAPAITPLAGGSWDSDGNRTRRLGGAAELSVGGATRLGARATRETVQHGDTTTGLHELAVHLASQPRAAFNLEATAGATLADARPASGPGPGPGPPVVRLHTRAPIATGELRARWRAPGDGPALDVRARRAVLDASPVLVANGVVRTELGGLLQLPVGRGVKVRGIGRAATLSDSAQLNHRTLVAGMLAYTATPTVEISGQFHQIRYAHTTTAGYFAPRLAQLVEAGSYIEVDTPRSGFVALDLGIGIQRVADQGASIGAWRRAFNLYSLIDWPLAPGRDLRLELDIEDSPAASETATAGSWRYGSAVLSLRWALP